MQRSKTGNRRSPSPSTGIGRQSPSGSPLLGATTASSVHHGVREKITGSGGRSSSNPKSVQGDMPLSAPQAGSFRRGSYLSAQGTAASRAHAAAAAAKKSRVEAYQGRAAISRQGTNFSRKEEAEAMREVGDFLRRRREELANRGELSLAHQKQPQATRAAVQADRGGLPAKEQKETQDMGSEKDEENAFVNVSQGEEDSEQNQPVDDSSISAETVDTDFLPRGSSNHSGLHSFMEQSRQSVRPLQQESVYASPEFVRSSQRCEGAQSCDPAGCSLEDFTREVAACILQHYWRHALKRRNKQCNPCHEDESDVVCPASGLPPRNAMDRDKQANSSLSSTSGCSTGIRSLLAGPVQPRSPLSVRSDAAANSPGFTPPAGSLKFHQSSSPLGLASVSEGCGKDLVQDAGSESVGNSVLAEHANGHSAKATPGHGPIGRRHEARGTISGVELEDVEEQAMKPLPQAGRRPMETVVPRSENEQELLTWVQGVVQGSGSGSGTGGSKGRQQGLADSPVTEDVGGFNTTDVAAWLEGVSIAEELLPRSPAKLPSPLLRSPLSQALKASGISGEGGRGSVQEKGREVDPLPPSNLQSSKSKDADRGGSGGRNGREDNNAHYQEGSERHYKSPAPNKVEEPMSPTAQPRVLFTSDDGSESLDDIRKGARAGSSFSEARQLFSDPPLVAQTSGFGRNEVHGEEVRESAHKLAEIMSFLDQVEQDVVAEPTAGVSGSAGAVASAGLTRRLDDINPIPKNRSMPLTADGDESSQLAANIFDGVKARMVEMQHQMKVAEQRAEAAEEEAKRNQEQAEAWVREAEARAAMQLERQQQENKSTIARHLEFIDRLLADKDSLSSKCTSLASEIQSIEARHEQAIASLKERWAAELKRQKDAWSAAEKIKRDSWAEEKTKEVKELTIKGLEPEIHRLMGKHRADMRKLEQRLGEEAQARLDATTREHEDYVRQLRDRLLKEREEAVEKERLAAADRVRDINERHEMQQQQQRQRLMSDADGRVEEVERLRRADRQRLEAAIEKAQDDAVAREVAVRAAAEEHRKQMQISHERAMAQAREQWDAQQEGWRAAVAERASQELFKGAYIQVAQCEKRIREELRKERDRQIETVMDRLEDEAAAAKQRLEEEYHAREEALQGKHSTEMREMEAAMERIAEKNRAVSRAQQQQEEELAEAKRAAQELERELKARNGTISWMESQLNDAKDGWEHRASELQDRHSRREDVLRRQLSAMEAEVAQARQEAAGGHERLRELQARKAQEMDHVESRIRAAIAKKDEVIERLRKDHDAVAAELRQTKDVLKRQQQALWS